jgi:hypothetical protein
VTTIREALLMALEYQQNGELADAAGVYRLILTIQPYNPVALSNLRLIDPVEETPAVADSAFTALAKAGALEAEGRLAAAKLQRDLVPRPLALLVQRAQAPHRTVLVLAHAGKGNVPLEALLPVQKVTRITWHIEYATEAQALQIPPYDVAFNAVGDADVITGSGLLASARLARQPPLNPLDKVARTRRDRMPGLLAGLPGVVAPAVLRLGRDAFRDGDIALQFAASDLAFPVLVRPIVAHGGEGIVRVATPDELAALRPSVADAYYVTALHDFGSTDGYYRKYRVIFVDRIPYAYHLAISPHWLVHYFSADMLAAPWKRAEESAFLEDPAAVLGPAAMAAITAIGQRLDLDFAGIDFSILPDGRVLVFEANATMLVHLNDSATDFPYKHKAVPAILAAFDAMLDRHAARYPRVNPSP